ncbi:MAG: enoyl-CoA hydratase-related protein [Gammaproteobacteria bacterium]|nr:enoyl-CoA hydratase-related protein [Gammaproteobacteria bacterium]
MKDQSPADAPVLRTEVNERIGVITLNRPHRLNALNGALIDALDGAVREMAADDGVKVVVLTGSPRGDAPGGFCSGGDIKDGGGPRRGTMGADPDAPEDDLTRYDMHAPMLLHNMPKPAIAMIGGPAIGAGCSLAAACDLRYASDDAVFATNFSANGLSGDYGGSLFWTRVMGTARTREFYYLNERLSARRAYEWGMLNRVLAPAELRDYTMSVAQKLLRVPATLLALVKNNLTEAEEEADRRRYLFDLEARNQRQAAKHIVEPLRGMAGE